MPWLVRCRIYHQASVRHFNSASSRPLHALRRVESVRGDFEAIDIDDFRQRAFIPERPLLIRSKARDISADSCTSTSSIPAATKWFTRGGVGTIDKLSATRTRVVPSYEYLSPYQDTILPYELTGDSEDRPSQLDQRAPVESDTGTLVPPDLLGGAAAASFHRFNAPLGLFLKACAGVAEHHSPPRLYIAQAQIADLPKQLQDDLPTPQLVKLAGKGDIYDSNIWMGLPPTYTPLHRDPNPNLFVQLASSKSVRLHEPAIGASVFREVQRRIGQTSQTNLRGHEMMEGPEHKALYEAIWGPSAAAPGLEAIVEPGDALFIPKGWWHTIKSIGPDVTASVNWWFR